jgi:hypothetical protein
MRIDLRSAVAAVAVVSLGGERHTVGILRRKGICLGGRIPFKFALEKPAPGAGLTHGNSGGQTLRKEIAALKPPQKSHSADEV